MKILTAVALAAASGGVCRAQSAFPSTGGHEVSVYLYADPDPALSAGFLGRAEQRVLLMLRVLLGDGAAVELQRIPALNRWLQDHTLHELTSSECRRFGCDQREKTLLLSIRYEQGAFELSAAEYDRHFDSFGPVRSAALVQRSMVADALGRLAMQCWTPVGTIVSLRDGVFRLAFKDHHRLLNVATWSRLQPGAVLQLFRETFDAAENKLQQDRHPSQYLQVEKGDAQFIRATPVGGTLDTPWFEHLNHSRARYLVRRVTPTPGDSTVKVLISGRHAEAPQALTPRAGCDVYLSDRTGAGTSGQLMGSTDRAGTLVVPVASDQLQFVTVAYDDIVAEQPLVRGVTEEPLVFGLQYRGGQSDFVTTLKTLQDEIRNREARINALARQIEAAAQAGDSETASRLTERALALTEARMIAKRAESVEVLARGRQLDVSAEAQVIYTEAAEFEANTRKLIGQLDAAKGFARREELKKEFGRLFSLAQWSAAQVALREYCDVAPRDAEAAGMLAKLSAALEPDDAQHETARAVVNDALGIARGDALMSRWDKIHDAVQVLLARNDALYLRSVAAEFGSWTRLINQQINAIKSTDQSALSRDEIQRLSDRADLLRRVSAEYKAMKTQVLAQSDRVSIDMFR